MDDGLLVRPIPGLTEAEMFTLVALRTQDAMEMAEVARVTNMSPTQVRTTVKHLLGRGILLRHDMGVRIATAFLPAVTLTLRRRHFLHWAV